MSLESRDILEELLDRHESAIESIAELKIERRQLADTIRDREGEIVTLRRACDEMRRERDEARADVKALRNEIQSL